MKKFLAITLLTAASLPALVGAQATTTATSTLPTTGTTTQITCMQSALEKRENSLITAHDTYNASVKTALINRLTALKNSWSEAEKKNRIAKREAAYKAFRGEMQSANTTIRNTKNTTWKTFQNDAKVCGIKGTGESPSMFSGANISL